MLHEIEFMSFNQRDKVYSWVYVPTVEPLGIVQIIHGLGEHSRRYLHMIVAFMDAGFIVAADDHVGHGKTAKENGIWGDYGDKGPHTMMEDEHTLSLKVRELYPDLPYFLFGHSMGSFIARDYIAKYGDELKGCTICGTASGIKDAEETEKKFIEAINNGRAMESDSLSDRGWMFSRIGEPKLGNEWICGEELVQYDHANDPFNGFMRKTTNRAAYDLFLMRKQIQGREWAEKVPVSLPIYNIAGDQDPVGFWGQGVYEVSNLLTDTHHQVETKLYSGYRHEIHNYDDIKDEVEEGIIDFMYNCL